MKGKDGLKKQYKQTDANSHIHYITGSKICCYKGEQRKKKVFHHSIVSNEPSVVEAVLLNSSMPTDFMAYIYI